jgi:hypothetical protein
MALKGAFAASKHETQVLIIQQFFVLVENIIGVDKRFQVFAYIVQFFG